MGCSLVWCLSFFIWKVFWGFSFPSPCYHLGTIINHVCCSISCRSAHTDAPHPTLPGPFNVATPTDISFSTVAVSCFSIPVLFPTVSRYGELAIIMVSSSTYTVAPRNHTPVPLPCSQTFDHFPHITYNVPARRRISLLGSADIPVLYGTSSSFSLDDRMNFFRNVHPLWCSFRALSVLIWGSTLLRMILITYWYFVSIYFYSLQENAKIASVILTRSRDDAFSPGIRHFLRYFAIRMQSDGHRMRFQFRPRLGFGSSSSFPLPSLWLRAEILAWRDFSSSSFGLSSITISAFLPWLTSCFYRGMLSPNFTCLQIRGRICAPEWKASLRTGYQKSNSRHGFYACLIIFSDITALQNFSF